MSAIFDEGLEIFGDFGERFGEGAVPDDAQGQGTRQQAAEGIESQGSVDAMLRFDRNMLSGCQKGGQGVEVVAWRRCPVALQAKSDRKCAQD